MVTYANAETATTGPAESDSRRRNNKRSRERYTPRLLESSGFYRIFHFPKVTGSTYLSCTSVVSARPRTVHVSTREYGSFPLFICEIFLLFFLNRFIFQSYWKPSLLVLFKIKMWSWKQILLNPILNLPLFKIFWWKSHVIGCII